MDWATIKNAIKTAFETASGSSFDVAWEHRDVGGAWRIETRIDLRLNRVRAVGEDYELISVSGEIPDDRVIDTAFSTPDNWSPALAPLPVGGQSDPFGGTAAAIWEDNVPALQNYADTIVGGADTTSQLAEIWIKKIDGGSTNIGVLIRLEDPARSATHYAQYQIDPGSGVEVNSGSYTPSANWVRDSVEISEALTGWYRVRVGFTSDIASDLRCLVYPAVADVPGTFSGAPQQAITAARPALMGASGESAPVTITKTMVGPRLIEVQCLIQTDEQDSGGTAPGQVASDVRTNLKRGGVRAALKAAGLSIGEIRDTLNADFDYADRCYSGATFEIIFNAAECAAQIDENGSFITSVQVQSNTIKDCDGTDTASQVDVTITKP